MVVTEKFNFNTFDMPLNFLSDIYNGKISLKEAEFLQKKLHDKIKYLQYKYTPKNTKEEEQINGVSMQANDMWKYRIKLLRHLETILFVWKFKKIRWCCVWLWVKNVNNFIQEIKSMEEKVNLSFFKEFFELLSPPDYSKMLINTKNPDENKEIVAEIKKQNIRFKRQNKRNEQNRKRKYGWDTEDYWKNC